MVCVVWDFDGVLQVDVRVVLELLQWIVVAHDVVIGLCEDFVDGVYGLLGAADLVMLDECVIIEGDGFGGIGEVVELGDVVDQLCVGCGDVGCGFRNRV